MVPPSDGRRATTPAGTANDLLTSVVPDGDGGGPKRIDARRNRKRILEVAYQVFAESGVDVQMTDIAKAAGLGVGTLYRNFASKEALVNALVEQRYRQALHGVEAAVVEPVAWDALVKMMRWLADQQLENQVLSQFLGGRIEGSEELQAQRARHYALMGKLVERAKREGHLRSDVGATDIRMIMISICNVATHDDPLTRRMVQRHLEIILDGLKGPAKSKLSGKPLTVAESDAVFSRSPAGQGDGLSPALRRGKRRWPV